MSINHPHWDMHYVPAGSVFTACRRRRIEVMHATNSALGVTCRWCRQSDEYLAQGMEEALVGGGLILVDDTGRVHQSWGAGESCKHFEVTNATEDIHTFKLQRRSGLVLLQVPVLPQATYSWRADFNEEIIA